MCNVCAALEAMRETLQYNLKGKKYFILAIGDIAEGPGKFQIRKDGSLWKDKWILSDNLAFAMAGIGADIKESVRSKSMIDTFYYLLNKTSK